MQQVTVAAILVLQLTSVARAAPGTAFVNAAPDLRSHLTVAWQEADPSTNDVEEFCLALAANMKPGGGRYGLGVFSTSSCLVNGVKVVGDQARSPWLLTVRVTADALHANLTFDPVIADITRQGTPTIDVARVQRPWPVDDGEELAAELAWTLLRAMPFQMNIAASDLTEGGRAVACGGDRRQSSSAPPTIEIIDFALAKGRPAFETPALGQGELVRDITGACSWRLEPGAAAAIQRKPRRVRIVLPPAVASAAPAISSTSVSAKAPTVPSSPQPTGESSVGDAATKTLGNAYDAAKDGLLTVTSSGFVGLRVGTAIAKGGTVLDRTKFVGLLGEFRGGPLSGLRVYYDQVPFVEEERKGQSISFGYTRIVAGRSFAWTMPAVVDEVAVIPKLGVWWLRSELPVRETDSELVTQKFSTGRSPSVGLEVSTQRAFGLSLPRLWVAADVALPFLNKVSPTQVDTVRIGGDAFFYLAKKPKKGLSAALIAFAFQESARLSREAASDDPNEITQVSYSNIYAGGGVAAAW